MTYTKPQGYPDHAYRPLTAAACGVSPRSLHRFLSSGTPRRGDAQRHSCHGFFSTHDHIFFSQPDCDHTFRIVCFLLSGVPHRIFPPSGSDIPDKNTDVSVFSAFLLTPSMQSKSPRDFSLRLPTFFAIFHTTSITDSYAPIRSVRTLFIWKLTAITALQIGYLIFIMPSTTSGFASNNLLFLQHGQPTCTSYICFASRKRPVKRDLSN